MKDTETGTVPFLRSGHATVLFGSGPNQKEFYKDVKCYGNISGVDYPENLTISGATVHTLQNPVTDSYGNSYGYYIYKDE